jgi:hypothetical protein
MKNFCLQLILVSWNYFISGTSRRLFLIERPVAPAGGRAFGVYGLAATWQELCVACVVGKEHKQRNIKQRYSSKKEDKEM